MNIFYELFSLKNNGFPKNAGEIEKLGIIEEEEKRKINRKNKRKLAAPPPPPPR